MSKYESLQQQLDDERWTLTNVTPEELDAICDDADRKDITLFAEISEDYSREERDRLRDLFWQAGFRGHDDELVRDFANA